MWQGGRHDGQRRGPVVPAVERVTNLVMLTAAGVVVVLGAVRIGVRAVRERLEDRADERTAARWRDDRRCVDHPLTPQGVA